ncbi:MAG: mannitol dehydrogenase family protein, partial [Lachnospiraceae bacterium]|nr:mannitol dehydrogenase family protein [Lachnospiraceae bacterium]
IVYNDASSYAGQLKSILSNEVIFASDLVEAGLSEKIEDMFVKMLAGDGSVRKTLHEYVAG